MYRLWLWLKDLKSYNLDKRSRIIWTDFQIAPVQDFIDENGLVKQIISLLGLPARMIRSDNQVAELRQQRAAAQAENKK